MLFFKTGVFKRQVLKILPVTLQKGKLFVGLRKLRKDVPCSTSRGLSVGVLVPAHLTQRDTCDASLGPLAQTHLGYIIARVYFTFLTDRVL